MGRLTGKTSQVVTSTTKIGVPPPSRVPGVQRVGAFTALPQLIRQLGVDPIPILKSAGVQADAFDDADNRIAYAALGRILQEGAARSRCAHFGLLVGRLWHLPDLGVVGELVRNSRAVGDALRALTVHQHLNSEGSVPFVREAAGVADLGVAIYEAGVAGLEQLFDAYMAAYVNFLRDLCGPRWAPSEVYIPSAKPRDCSHHRHNLKVMPRFGAEFCAIRFSAHWLGRPVEGADPELLRLAESRAHLSGAPNIVQQVSRALRVLLLDGKNSGDDVARVLSMHRRTLNRHLHVQGTTFQCVLDKVRFEVARQLVSSSKISLDDVAGSLGYAGVSPFMRSFRRWSGMTPGDWRHQFGHQRADADALQLRPAAPGTSTPSPNALFSTHQTHDHRAPLGKQNVRNSDGGRVAQNRN